MAVLKVLFPLLIFVAALAVSVFAGYAGWGPLAVLALAAILAVNKAVVKLNAETSIASQLVARSFVNYPLMLVFSGVAYGLGYLLREGVSALF